MKQRVEDALSQERACEFPFREAIVIGGGIAGLSAAQALVDHVARVTIVERDRRSDQPGDRPGVPQTHHPHNLQPQAQRVLERFFPGLTEELLAERAVRLGEAGDVAFYYAGSWQTARVSTRNAIMACSRGLLEKILYRRIHAHPRIEVLYGYEIAGLNSTEGGRRVSGVRLLPRPGTAGGERQLPAELVVDASGRRSRAPEWLAELGYQPPEEWHIDAQVGYASRVYERPAEFEAAWKMLYIRPTPPAGTRGGIIIPLEGERWHVALVGVAGDYPPTDEDEFLAFARSLPTDRLYEAIRDARPLSRIYGFRRADNRVRRFDRLTRQPEGFLVTGDAAYALNPLYSQGMTAAILTSETLAEVLEKHVQQAGGDVRGLAHTFQEEASEAVEGPWRLATRNDWRWAATVIEDNTEGLDA
jgi:2-polyprenyl-6-methoxyphenol hydroxylase-like FAD-dependent oxidoreductase